MDDAENFPLYCQISIIDLQKNLFNLQYHQNPTFKAYYHLMSCVTNGPTLVDEIDGFTDYKLSVMHFVQYSFHEVGPRAHISIDNGH